MDKKEFINRRNAIKEDFRVRVDKEGDALSVEAEGENSQEFFDFARCLFGDNFDSFNCDFSDPVQPEQQVEAEIPEVGFDYEAEDQMVDVDDPFTVFDDEPVEEVHVEGTTEESKEEEPEEVEETEVEDHEEEEEEDSEEDHKYKNQPMDMINGKLVPAKDPTASEVEIDGEEELEEDLNVSKYDCYYKDEFVGSVYAMSEDEAYSEMEKVWPELNYGEYDGVADVVLSDYSEDDFLKAFGEALYGKKQDLKEAELGEATPEKELEATQEVESKATKELSLESLNETLSEYTKIPLSAKTVNNYEKYFKLIKPWDNSMTGYIYLDGEKPVALLQIRKENPVFLNALEITPEYRGKGLSKELLDVATKELGVKKLGVELDNTKAINIYKKYGFKPTGEKTDWGFYMQLNEEQKDLLPTRAMKPALDKAGFDTSDLVNGKKASDKLNTIRKDLFGEGLQEDYKPESEEEKALWDKLSDNDCGPDYEYELTYDARNYENSKSVPKVRQTYDGDYIETGTILVGTYYGSFEYYKAPTYEDVLEFLGEDHLTEEGAERFIADDKKKENSEFVEFLTNKYEEEAVDKFQEDLEDGEYDDQMDWEEDWPEPDYDDYDD